MNHLNQFPWCDLPTRARMTVSSGAAGKAMVMFISNIWRRSTEGERTRPDRHTVVFCSFTPFYYSFYGRLKIISQSSQLSKFSNNSNCSGITQHWAGLKWIGLHWIGQQLTGLDWCLLCGCDVSEETDQWRRRSGGESIWAAWILTESEKHKSTNINTERTTSKTIF